MYNTTPYASAEQDANGYSTPITAMWLLTLQMTKRLRGPTAAITTTPPVINGFMIQGRNQAKIKTEAVTFRHHAILVLHQRG